MEKTEKTLRLKAYLPNFVADMNNLGALFSSQVINSLRKLFTRANAPHPSNPVFFWGVVALFLQHLF